MIVVDIFAGLGNQMFQYAFARALQQRSGGRLLLNPYSMTRNGDNRRFGLQHFALGENVTVPPVSVQKFWDAYSKLKRRILTRNNSAACLHGEAGLRALAVRGLYATRDCYDYYDLPLSKCRVKYIIGYWQSPRYFDALRPQLCSELRIVTPASEANVRMRAEISGCNAVCVHIRLGDYLKYPELNLCTPDYYRAGMRYISEHTADPVFYVFSTSHDDLETIRRTYGFDGYDVRYVDLDNPDYEELRLMAACRHFIIANSTFSWWAQYLADAPDKLVVAPGRWIADAHVNDRDIYMPGWHCISL